MRLKLQEYLFFCNDFYSVIDESSKARSVHLVGTLAQVTQTEEPGTFNGWEL